MPEWDDFDLTERERQLESELAELGPVMREAARSRVEGADPAFLTSLRARLVEPESVAPGTGFQRRSRRRLVGRRFRLSWPVGPAAGAAVAALVAVLLVLHPRGTAPKRPPLAAGIPQPAKQDLTRGYPTGVYGGGGAILTPMISRAEGLPGLGYLGRLHLTAGSWPQSPVGLSVYRLATDPFRGSSFAAVVHRLGIPGKPFCMSPRTEKAAPCTSQTWTVAAENLFPAPKPMHSLAVNATGEVVYHDLSYQQTSYRGPAMTSGQAVTSARSWLAVLGWPAADMPVLSVRPVTQFGPENAGLPLAVSFGWKRGVPGDVPAAVVWVAPTGRVVEAHLWPPIVRARVVAARDVSDAWRDVQSGKAPVAVEGNVLYLEDPGSGSASRVDVVQVLVAPARGPAYLKPAYRFAGKVTLGRGMGVRDWYALVPAVARS